MNYYDARSNWLSRNPTRRGRVDPLPPGPFRHGEASRAKDRYNNKVAEIQARARYVQLTPGAIVIYDWKPWRVLEVREQPMDLWGETYEQAFHADVEVWEKYQHGDRPEKATWRGRPINFVLAPDREPNAKPLHLIGPAHYDWPVLPEHYAVCRSCGKLPPCPEEVTTKAVELQVARTEVLMSIPAGHCLACGEAITSRMKAVRFPGPNLWRPDLGDDSAVFHAREECSGDVYEYREQWQAKGNEDAQQALPGLSGDTQ